MQYCPSCHASIDPKAAFCSSCGKALSPADRGREFELGKLAALDEVKTDVRKWLGGSVAVLLVIVTIVTFFGGNALIQNAVVSEVQKEISRTTADVSKVFIDVGKAQANQLEIAQILDESKAKLREVETQEVVLSKSIGDLNTTKNETVRTEASLEAAIKSANMTGLMAKLRYDFYHVRDFSANVVIGFKSAIPQEDLINISAPNLNLLVASKEVGEMRPTVGTMIKNNNGNVTGIIYQYSLYAPFEVKFLGRGIADLPDIDSAQIHYSSPTSKREPEKSLLEEIKLVHIKVLVNWMPLWDVSLDSSAGSVNHVEENGSVVDAIDFKLPPFSNGLVPRYEALFADTTR